MLADLRRRGAARALLALALAICVQIGSLDLPCFGRPLDVRCGDGSALRFQDGVTVSAPEAGNHANDCHLCQWVRRLPLPQPPHVPSIATHTHTPLLTAAGTAAVLAPSVDHDPARAPPV